VYLTVLTYRSVYSNLFLWCLCTEEIEILNFSLLENCTLLRYYAASSGNFLPTIRDNLSDSSSGEENSGIQDSGPLKMELICWPETFVSNYHYSLHTDPKERGFNLLCCGSLKSFLLPVDNCYITIACARVKPKTYALRANVSKSRFLRYM